MDSGNSGRELNRKRRKLVALETGKCSYCRPHGGNDNTGKRRSRANVRDRKLEPIPAPRYDDVYFDGVEWLEKQ